jgi:hypothetical protein
MRIEPIKQTISDTSLMVILIALEQLKNSTNIESLKVQINVALAEVQSYSNSFSYPRKRV